MATVTYFTDAPDAIEYMTLPTGNADVWLRQNIEEIIVTDDDTGEETLQYSADEVYFRTSLTLDEVTEQFDYLFENDGPEVDDDTGEELDEEEPTLKERVDAMEDAVTTIAALVAELTGD